MDRRTDRILIARLRLHSVQRGKNVIRYHLLQVVFHRQQVRFINMIKTAKFNLKTRQLQQCKGDYITPLKQQKSLWLTHNVEKSRCAPTRRADNMNQPTENRPIFNTCNSSWPHITCTTNDQHSGSSCKGTSGILHIIGSNTMIFAVLKA